MHGPAVGFVSPRLQTSAPALAGWTRASTGPYRTNQFMGTGRTRSRALALTNDPLF